MENRPVNHNLGATPTNIDERAPVRPVRIAANMAASMPSNGAPQPTVNIKGDPGPVGPTGPRGAVGQPGPKGDPGSIGPTGSRGPMGPMGPLGPTGPRGIAGPEGEVGRQGPVGPTGPMGPQGPLGLKGLRGERGLQGIIGPTGTEGTRGPSGIRGAAGPTGPIGPTGPKGDTGPAGPRGPRGESGAGAGGRVAYGYRHMTSTSTEYYEVMSEPVIKLDAEGLAENVGMDEADTITIEDDGVYEIRYLVKVQEAEQTATMSVKVTRNGQPFEGDEPAKQIVGLTDSRSLPIPAVFEGHIVERLRRGDRLRLEQDAPCVVWLQQGRSASLYVRKID